MILTCYDMARHNRMNTGAQSESTAKARAASQRGLAPRWLALESACPDAIKG
jgi:hypothetical protein